MAIKLIVAVLILGTIVWEQTTPGSPNLCQKRYDVAGQGIAWQCQGGTVSVWLKSQKARNITLSVDRASTAWVFPHAVVPHGWTIHSGGQAHLNKERALYISATTDVLVYVYSSAPRYEMTAAWGKAGAQ